MKSAALEKILETRPELKDVLSIGNMSVKGGKVMAALMGEEYFEPKVEEAAEGEMAPAFLKVENEEVDVGGTPMQVGRVTLGPQAETMDEDALMSGIIDFIETKTGLTIPENAIQINLSKGEAAFAFDPEATPTTAPIENPTMDSSIPPEEEEPDMFDEEDEDEEAEDAAAAAAATAEDAAVAEPIAPTTPVAPKIPSEISTAKSIYNFPIVIADSKDSKKK
jgi:hypothetical protein